MRTCLDLVGSPLEIWAHRAHSHNFSLLYKEVQHEYPGAINLLASRKGGRQKVPSRRHSRARFPLVVDSPAGSQLSTARSELHDAP